MISFIEHYHEVHQVRLEKNFRCALCIVDIADAVIGHNESRIQKKMISGATETTSEIKATKYSDKKEQFDAIAEKIAELRESGVPYNEMAILVRKGKVIAAASVAFDRAEITFETDSAEHFFAGNYFNHFVTTL